MRCFLAVDLSEEVKDYLNNIIKSIDSSEAKVGWVTPNQLHLTLKFLGEVSEDKIEKVVKELDKIEFQKFELKITNFGVFPDYNYVRILWVDTEPIRYILELKTKVEKSLLDFFPKEDKRFLPHITIGRVKFVKDGIGFVKRLKDVKILEKSFIVNNFKLYKSNLTSDGPIYEVLKEFRAS